jgi:hypothetical protein
MLMEVDPAWPWPKDPRIFVPAPILEDKHVRNCRMLPGRDVLLHHLKKNAVCGEVGTHRGVFAADIVRVCQPKALHLFDLDFAPFHTEMRLRADENVILHEGDSAANLSAFPDEYFDWLYIDADHSYEGVRRDIEAGVRKIRRDGLLVFNDYTFWSPLDLHPFGVVQAVHELCLQHDFEFVFFALHWHMYCDVAVRRRTDR